MENEPIAFGKNIILEEVKQSPKEGILIIPEEQQSCIKAKVVSIGPDVEETLRLDDEVLISKYGHIEMKFNRKDYLVCKPENIYAYVIN